MTSSSSTTSVSFLDRLDAGSQRVLRDRAVPRTYEPDATLFREGDRSDHVLIVTRGRVKVASLRPGVGELLLAERGPGDLLGELSAIDGRPRSADAVAIDEVGALSLPSDEFHQFLAEQPGAAVVLLEILADRLRAADQRTVEFGEVDAVVRVARGLCALSETAGEPSGPWTMLPMDAQELAVALGVSSHEVRNALELLAGEGVLESHRRGVTIVDAAGLEKRSR
jgi:CRP/FNR family transcriptional regulator, cyclic AMP receptor protein